MALLLRRVQRVPRDARTLQPLPGAAPEVVELADLSVLVLAHMIELHSERLAAAGWVACGDYPSMAGGLLYRKTATGRRSEEPDVVSSWGWTGQLMHELPCLSTCTGSGAGAGAGGAAGPGPAPSAQWAAFVRWTSFSPPQKNLPPAPPFDAAAASSAPLHGRLSATRP